MMMNKMMMNDNVKLNLARLKVDISVWRRRKEEEKKKKRRRRMMTMETSMRVRGMVTRQRQRSEIARLAMNTFLLLLLLIIICSNGNDDDDDLPRGPHIWCPQHSGKNNYVADNTNWQW